MSLLLNESPVFIQPSLVRRVGLLEAAILQQLHYWSDKARNVHDGHVYVYKTYQDWSDEIGVSAKAVRGAMDRMRKDGFVVGIQNPTDARDRTIWWRIDHDVLDPGAPSAPEGSPTPPRGVRPSAPTGSSNAGASGSSTSTTTSSNAIERAPGQLPPFRGRKIPADVATAATDALAGWNERTGQSHQPTKASGKLTDACSRIVGAMLDYPEAVELWPRMMDATLARPWWEGEPSTGVVFGAKTVEGAIQQAKAPATKSEAIPGARGHLKIVNGRERVDWQAIGDDLRARGM